MSDWSRPSPLEGMLKTPYGQINVTAERDLSAYTTTLYVDIPLPDGVVDVNRSVLPKTTSLYLKYAKNFPIGVYAYPSLFGACRWALLTALDDNLPDFINNTLNNDMGLWRSDSLDAKNWKRGSDDVAERFYYIGTNSNSEYSLFVSELKDGSFDCYANAQFQLSDGWLALGNDAKDISWSFNKKYEGDGRRKLSDVAAKFALESANAIRDAEKNMSKVVGDFMEELKTHVDIVLPRWASPRDVLRPQDIPRDER